MSLRGNSITVYLGLSSFCNLACKYCYRNINCAADLEQSRLLPLRYVSRLATLLRAEGYTSKCRVVLHGHEPLLARPSHLRRTFTILDEAGIRFSVYVRTNGTVVDRKTLELLSDRRATVGVAIDGPELIHDSVRAFSGGGGSLTQVLRNVDTFRSHGLRVLAFCVYTKLSLGHESAIFDFFHSHRLDFEFARVNIAKTATPQLWVSPLEAANFHNRMFDLYVFQKPRRVRVRRIDRLIQRVLSSSTTVTEKACFDNGIFLDFDGFLYQCPGLAGSRDQAIGHIEDAKSLKGIFASDFAIRQSVALNGVFQKCNSCDLYDLCPGGCYYNASVEGTLPDDPVFCKFFRVVAPHVIERVYSSFAANSKIASLE